MKHFKLSFLIIGFLLIIANVGWGQWTYDFGTGTGSYATASGSSTTFLTSTPANGGTYRVRCASTGNFGSGFVLANPGTTLGTGTELQINASLTASTNKFGVYDWTSPSTVAYSKFKLRTTSTGNGVLVLSLGVNTLVSDNNGYTSQYNNSLAMLILTYSSGSISATRRISGGTNVVSGFLKDTDQLIEIYANNGSGSVNYSKSGANTLATKTWDLWVDGVKVVSNAPTAGTLTAGTNLSGFGFFAESSTSNAAFMYIDDIEYSNILPSGIKPEPTNHATSFATGTITGNSIQLNWTDATGTTLPDGYLIKGSDVSYSSITIPVDGTAESNSALVRNVTQGTQTYTFSGLSSTTTYYFKIYPYTNSGTNINYKTDGTVPQIDGLTGAASTLATDYFRSKATGDWNATSTWESSSDNTNWINSSLTPDNNANTITILNGHTVTISGNLTVDQVVVNSGGVLVNSGTVLLTINDGTGDDVTINNGGVYQVTNTNAYTSAISFTGSTFRVKTGGKIEIKGGTSNNGYAISSNVIWESASIFDWNLGSRQIGITGITLFPNNNASAIPILRFTDVAAGLGGNSNSVFNCLFEANTTVSFTGTGTKTFNYGFSGTGTIAQNNSGQFILGSNSELPSTTTLILSTGGLSIGSKTFTVKGILNCGSGSVSGTNGVFTLFDGATIKTSSATGLNGAITSTGTKTFSSSANYEFQGASTGTFTTSPTANTVNNLTINKSSGFVTLGQELNVNGTLTLTSGNLKLGNNNLTINSTASITGGSSSSYIVTDGFGLLKRTVQNDDAFVLFPVGNSAYNPLQIKLDNASTTDVFSVKVNDVISNPGYVSGKTVTREWNISESVSGSSNATVRFQFNSGEGITDLSSGEVGHWKGSFYEILAASISGSGPYIIENTQKITSFSPFIVANQGAAPVRLKTFSFNLKPRLTVLNWITSEEENNSGFDIERKQLKGEWSKIGFVNGNGTKYSESNYLYEDRNLQSGKYQYRLKQIDYNGNFEYFNLDGEVEVGVPSKFDLSQNYPNPFNPVTKINYDLPVSGNVSLKVFDMLGKEVASVVNEYKEAGYHTISFDASKLTSGVYFYKLTAGNNSAVKKLVVLK